MHCYPRWIMREIIFICSIIFIRNDELWQEIEEDTFKKSQTGCGDPSPFDSMGCRGMKNSDWDRLEKAGIQVAEFFPACIRKTAASCELPKPPEDCSD